MIIINSNSENKTYLCHQPEKAMQVFEQLTNLITQPANYLLPPKTETVTEEYVKQVWGCYLKATIPFNTDIVMQFITPLDEEEIQDKIYAKFQATAAISYAAGMLLKKTPSKDDDIVKFIDWGNEFDELHPAESFKSKPAEYYYTELGKFFDSKMEYFDKK